MSSIYGNDNDKVVGFKKEAETIINQLIHASSKEREVVLITGMGGLGKTTLAKRVYDEKNIANHFHTRAWCTVSQEYDCKDLLRKIYRQVCGSEIEIDSVAEELRKRLMGRRYLIVLDDIWSVKAWEEFNRDFPSCNNGSRIVLTSREESVISDAKHIPLPFFTTEESWELLKVKLFKGNRCLEELENVGREISNKCKGLPLTIGLIAGLLEKVEKSEQMWRKFLLTLNSHVTFGEGIESNDAIKFSDKHLSRHLKPCLLYFAAFQEDEEIEVEKLKQLWICEGFIEKGIVEDEAEGYLNHLVCSNLIMVSEKKYDDRITRCTVHDLVRDFCLIKAKEENFLEVIDLKKKLDRRLNFTSHRICFHRQGDYNYIPYGLVPQNSAIGTFLVFQKGINSIPLYYNSGWIAVEFKHLTILDLETTLVSLSFLHVVNSLIHLRYLALLIDGDARCVSPLSLGNLECLITLKLQSARLHLPFLFLNMRSLRHMIIDTVYHRDKDCEKKSRSAFEAIPYSEGLQTWILPCALTTEDEHLLRKFPHLKTLSCGVSKYPFPEIDFLHHLEYLTLSSVWEGYALVDLVNDLKFSNFPSSIKKIELKFIKVSVSAISIIAQLPNLEALTLRCCEFEEDSEWNLEEETQFCKLKCLQLFYLDIIIWNVSSAAESFPCLETLHLDGCQMLEDLPSSFEDVLTLKEISVMDCNQNVDRWGEKILEYARDMGNEQLNVKISSSSIYGI